MQAPSSATGDILDLKKANGSLLYITVHELVTNVTTKYGPSDAIRCDVAVLDGTDKGAELQGVLLFPQILRRQLAPSVGAADNVVVGRLGQGQAKVGQDAPWVLNEPTRDDMEVALRFEAYVAKRNAEVEAPF